MLIHTYTHTEFFDLGLQFFDCCFWEQTQTKEWECYGCLVRQLSRIIQCIHYLMLPWGKTEQHQTSFAESAFSKLSKMGVGLICLRYLMSYGQLPERLI